MPIFGIISSATHKKLSDMFRKTFPLVSSLAVIACALSCTGSKDTGITLTSDIPSLEFSNGEPVQLIPGATHEDEAPAAEAVVTDGAFTLHVGESVPEARYYVILLGKGSEVKVAHVFLSNGSYTLKGATLEDATVPDSRDDALMREKTHFRDVLDSVYLDYNTRYEGLFKKLASDDATRAEAMKSDEYKAMSKEESDFFSLAHETIMQHIRNNSDSYWGPLLMLINVNYFSGPESEEFREVFEGFSPEAQESYYGQILRNELYPQTVVGGQVPSFSAKDRDGNEISVDSARKGKKWLLLDFWASWCNPCRAEIPNLKALYSKYAPKGLEILSVSIDKDRDAWLQALDEEQLPWPNVLDENKIFSGLFYGQAIPTMFLVDENGNVVSDSLRGEALAAELAKLLD